MERDQDHFKDSTSGSPGEAADDRIDALIAALPPCPALPSTDEEIAAADARAEADIAAGRVHPHEQVSRWLRTWGSPDYKPFHEWRT